MATAGRYFCTPGTVHLLKNPKSSNGESNLQVFDNEIPAYLADTRFDRRRGRIGLLLFVPTESGSNLSRVELSFRHLEPN
jgi:hypothetical protein